MSMWSSAIDCSCIVFTCVAALAILDRLDEVDSESLAWWLSERQLPNGGLNGRPEKLEDVSVVSLTAWVVGERRDCSRATHRWPA